MELLTLNLHKSDTSDLQVGSLRTPPILVPDVTQGKKEAGERVKYEEGFQISCSHPYSDTNSITLSLFTYNGASQSLA